MKKIIKYIMRDAATMSAVALSIFATSCSNDEPAFPTEHSAITFTTPTQIGDASSRVTYEQDENMMKVRWYKDDLVNLVSSDNKQLAVFQVTQANEKSTTFKCIEVTPGVDLKDVTGKLIYKTSVAGYVQKENGVASGGTKGVSHLQGANVIEASFKNQNFTSGNLEFKFKNTTAIIRIVVTPKYAINPGATITVSGSSTWASSGNNTLTLEDFNVKAGETLVAYIAVPQATVARYLMVKIKNSNALLSLNYLGITNNTTYYQGREYTANLDGDKIYYYVSYGVGKYEYVDLGIGTKWATMNIGATDLVGEDSYGEYFAWGNETPINGNSQYDTNTKQPTASDAISGQESITHVDVAESRWGADWATPTQDQCDDLLEKCNWEWNDVLKCYLVTPKSAEYSSLSANSAMLFIPAAGYYEVNENKYVINGKGTSVDYWTATTYHVNDAFCINLSNKNGKEISGDIQTYFPLYYALPIRPVFVKQ